MLLQQAGTHALALGVCNMPWGSLLYPKKMLDIEIVSVAPRCWGTVALAMSVAFGIQMGSASCIKLHKAPQLWFFDDFFSETILTHSLGHRICHISWMVFATLTNSELLKCWASRESPGFVASAKKWDQLETFAKFSWPQKRSCDQVQFHFCVHEFPPMISAHSTGQTAACACIHVGMFLESWPSELRTPHFWSRMGHSAGTSNVLGEVHYAARFFLTSSFLYTQIWRNVTIWHRF